MGFLILGFMILSVKDIPHVYARDYLPQLISIQEYMKEINPGGMVKMVSDRPFTSRGFIAGIEASALESCGMLGG